MIFLKICILVVTLSLAVLQLAHCKKKSNKFDFFTFTQDWPMVICVKDRSTGEKCHISRNVTGWTIHGLWPSVGSSKGPAFCNNSSKFNESAIEKLLPALDVYWPNLHSDTVRDDFWAYEWSKHGTCAKLVKETRNEYLYFKKALDLFQMINFTGILTDIGVIPDDNKLYDVLDILNKITPRLSKVKGIKPRLSCYKYKEQFYLTSVIICFTKQFEMTSCLQKPRDNRLYFQSLKDKKQIEKVENLANNDDLIDCPHDHLVKYPTIRYH
ncbi:hypothetical protein SNE40_009097 [Patella caerulea]|uniref:Uncharacterized protein n=2 Tax=Patella caerulea TaxID=87958 RepID=A0AAN8PXK8_PATCE